jgi:hypothetical protein
MPLLIVLFVFMVIKGIIWLPFYIKQAKPYLLVALFTTMAVTPCMTLLYHETDIDFTIVYFAIMLLDMVLLFFLVQRNAWKAVPASFLANTIAIIGFFIGNG